MRRNFTRLLAAGTLLAFIPCGSLEAVEFQKLPKALLWGHEMQEADWNQVLEDRIKAGEPMPEWSDPDGKKPDAPADRAEPAEHLAFWRARYHRTSGFSPSAEARRKILEAIRADILATPETLEFLPQDEPSARIVASLLPKLPVLSAEDGEKARDTRAWIYLNSGLLREEIIKDVSHMEWARFDRSNRTDPSLNALRIREPAEAARIFKTYMDGADRGLAVIGARLMMEMAPGEESYRLKLIAAASDASLSEDVRKIAVESLLDQPWDGIESWILASIGQEAPLRGEWFFWKIHDTPDHWIPLLREKLHEGGRARTTAVELLVLFDREDSIRPLLPWLKDRDWCAASAETLTDLVKSLGKWDFPECADDLMKLMNESTAPEFKVTAATALARYKRVEAVITLKKILTNSDHEGSCDRAQLIESIQKLGGFEPSEIVPALEAYFTAFPDTGGDPDQLGEPSSIRDAGQSGDPAVRNGACFAAVLPQTPELLAAMELRAKAVAKNNPVLARNFSELAARYFVAAAGRILAEELAEEKLGERGLVLGLMHRRDRNPLWTGNEFRNLAKLPGTAGGLAAVLSGDPKLMNAALGRKSSSSQMAVLAAAGFTGDLLDLQQLRELLDSKDKVVAEASWSHLLNRVDQPALAMADKVEKSRSPEIWDARGPNQDLVRSTFGISDLPTERMSLATMIQGSETGRLSVLFYPGRAFAIRSFREGRRGICELNAAQINRLKDYVARYRIDDLPSMAMPVSDGIMYGFAHVTANQARSFSMDNPPESLAGLREFNDRKYSEGAVVYVELVKRFQKLFGELDLKFSRGEGIEILLPRERGNIKTVWKKGSDLRVFVDHSNGSGAGFWQGVDAKSGEFLGAVEEPPEVPMLEAHPQLFPGFYNDSIPSIHPWQVRTGDSLIHAGEFEEVHGLWLCRRGKDPELLTEGFFHGERVSQDGKWCLVVRRSGADLSESSKVIRINLETKETFPVDFQDAGSFSPLAFVNGAGKFLVRRARHMYPIPGKEPVGPRAAEYYLVDPAAGTLQLVKGDFSPLKEKLSRPLQATANPQVAWASKSENYINGAITYVGLYDSADFKFRPAREIKGISFESADMWVDEEEGMIYAAADGDLVKIPLKAK